MSAGLMEIFANGQIYLLLYAFFALIMIVEGLYENKALSQWMARASVVILIIFIGLRWETGTDWKSYFNIFYTSLTNADYDSIVFGVDQGYIFFNRILYYFSYDYTIFLLVDALISIVAVYIFIERSTKYPCMGVYLFYTSYAITHFMGSNRRMLAIGFVCIGFLFLRSEGRLWRGWPRWVVPFALASAFHRTAVMALPGLFVNRRAWPAWAVIPGLLICAGLGVSGTTFSIL